MTNGEVVKKSILTWRFILTLILIAIAVAILTPVTNLYTPRWAYFSLAIATNIPLAIMFIALIIGNLFPERVSSKHIALISATSIMAMLIPGRALIPEVFNVMVNVRTSTFGGLYSLTFGPYDIKYFNEFLLGHVDVPWGEWLPTLIWWAMYSVAWLLLLLAFLSIVRHRWMDIEMLPYPVGYAWSVPIIATSPERRLKGLPIDVRLAMYLAGLVVGFFYTFLLVLKLIIPWMPDILGWTTGNFVGWYPGAISIDALPNLKRIIGLIVVPTNIIEYITFTLVPLDILLSAWITSLALLLTAQVSYLRGYYSGIEKENHWGRFMMLGQLGPLKLFAMRFGIYLGVGLFWLILNARYLGNTLMRAIRGPTREEVEREAITYRTAWFTVLICLINLFILYYAADVKPFGAFLIILQYLLLGLSVARIYGLTPVGAVSWQYLFTLPQLAYYNEELNAEYLNAIALGQRTCTGQLAFNTSYAAMFFRIARDTDVSPRDMFIALLIGAMVGGILQWFITLKFVYTVGYSILPGGGTVGPQISNAWIAPKYLQLPAQRPWWPQLSVGLALTGILSYLRARLVWWPIDPVGVAIGFSYTFAIPNSLFGPASQPFVPFIAWIIKYLVIKTGGARVHDHILVPFAAGALSGAAICWFVGGIAIVLTRVIPFT